MTSKGTLSELKRLCKILFCNFLSCFYERSLPCLKILIKRFEILFAERNAIVVRRNSNDHFFVECT